MNNPEYQRLLETGWRRELTPEETARLTALFPAAGQPLADWQAEARLTSAIRWLPQPPLASNFTARLLRAAQVEQTRAKRPAVRKWVEWFRSLGPRPAWAAVVLVLGLVTLQTYGHFRRVRVAQDLASIPVVASIPSPDILQDFDAIQQFSQAPSAPAGAQPISDEALLTALQ